ncbi:PREDICTED: ATP-dependent zinc metalloprotease YME1L1-like [Ceratotherium simum simum]|uniref:ATP-dependent zinc metalloprotease YME1L1-like n=1 Tax=Ceratotherium simum simum TaxID=73337 RepID=A0ABM1CHH4_CERSS|nr:PREDICTED: ATP-dependent zinc metalloprotease YME1L1-like [Ceratotherium simum simum]
MQPSWCQPGFQVYIQFTTDSLLRLFVVAPGSTSGIPHGDNRERPHGRTEDGCGGRRPLRVAALREPGRASVRPDCICFRFKSNERVIVGATNFPEALDNALIHPGHFDMQVTVPRPDVKGQTEILKWYLNKIKFDQCVDPEIIAQGTVGFSGAELENLMNQTALKAAVDGKEMVTMKELVFQR